MKNKLLILLIIITFLTLPTPALAESQENQPGLLDILGSGISQLLALNHPVHLDNPQSQFTLDQSPVFTLITPSQTTQEEITANIIREKGNKTLTVLIKMIEPGKFEISLQDPLKAVGDYILEVTAKESFFYNRRIILNFSWGDLSKLSTQKGGGFMKSFLTKNPQYQKLPVVKRDKNSVHFQKPDGTLEAQISSGPINFQNDKGDWQPIDTDLTQVGDELVGQGTPVKIKLDGTVEASGSAHSQKTIRFGWLDSSTGQLSGMVDLPLGKASGDQFIREGDFYKHVLTLLDTGLKEELILSDLPPNLLSVVANGVKQSQDSHPELVSGSNQMLKQVQHDKNMVAQSDGNYLILETEVTGINLPDGWIEKEIKKGEFTFPLPTTKDATGKEISTKRFAKKVNGVQYIYTGILLSDLKTSAFPVTIDPDFSPSSDINVNGNNGTYATARTTASSFNSITTQNWLGQYVAYLVFRHFLKFNTSSIGQSSTINQINLKMGINADQSTTDFDVQIVKYDWSGNDPISSANQNTAYNGCLTGDNNNKIWRNTLNISTNTQYSSDNLDTDWINKTGSTYYCLRSSRDYGNNTPTGDEIIMLYGPSGTVPPVLTITYTVPPVFQFSGLKMQGVKIQ